MSSAHPNSDRVYFLDYTKAFVTALVVAQHVAFAYTTYASYYPPNYILSSAPVIDPMSWFGIDLFEDFNDKFFMSLMFFIAGFFTFGSVKTKGLSKYIVDRILRLGLPFSFAAFFLAPLSYLPAYWAVGGSDTYLNYWFKDFLPSHWLPGPVWFIWVLLSFSVLGAFLVHFYSDRISQIGDKVGTLRNHPWKFLFLAWALCILVYTCVFYFIPGNGPDTWGSLAGPLWCQKNRYLLYFLVFCLGLALGGAETRKKTPKVLEYNSKIMAYWPGFLVLALISHFFMVYIENNELPRHTVRLIWVPSFTLSLLTSSLGFLGFFCRNKYKKTAIGNWLARNAYTVYLIHYPICIWLQYSLIDFEWHAGIKFLLVTITSLVGTWIVASLIRKIPVLKTVL